MTDDSSLTGKRVLLIEDEALVAMLIEDMLTDEGCVVAATAGRLADALKLAGEPAFAVAEVLASRGVPFAFATGYGAGGLPETWRSRPTLQKPFTAVDVRGVLELLAKS